jgi:SAM-dependent methyltransferase
VDTEFYVDHSQVDKLIKKYGRNWPYHELKEGEEWLAFVFQGQEIGDMTKKEMDKLFQYSEKDLIDAYSRMDIQEHPWARGSKNEVDFLSHYFTDVKKLIIDFGCGTGRHVKEFYSRGYNNVLGIDFSERNIDYCKEKYPDMHTNFRKEDCRYFNPRIKYDYALCLYDVIGSFPVEKENNKIIKNLYRVLRKGGIAVISVMNMELTQNIAKSVNVVDVYHKPQKLFKLKASHFMQSTGDIFDPDFYIIDVNTKIVFRKEKFFNDGSLSAEYIVRDKRYTMTEIVDLVTKIGFTVIEHRYVQAGKWDISLKNTNLKAKEILLVLKK